MAFIAKSGIDLEPQCLHHGDILRFGGGKRQADKYERFVYRVDATAFPPLSRQASLQPSPTPPNRSSSSPAPLFRGNSDALAPDSQPTHPAEPTHPTGSSAEPPAGPAAPTPAGPPAGPPAAGPPAGPPIWSWQSDKASGVWS